MENLKTESGDWKTRTKRMHTRLVYWAGAYILTTMLAAFGPQLLWESNKWLTIAAILLSLGAGIGMIVANIQHLNNLDEMMRKIELEARSIALGVGIIGGLSYGLLDTENIIPFDAEIGYMVILIGITYLIALLAGCRRYK